MASYEFPNNSNSNNSNTTVNDVSSMKVKIDDTGNPIKVTWANGTPLTKEEMEKFSNEISDKVDELKEAEEEKRKKREELWKGVKEGFSDVTDKVADVGSDVSEHVTDEVFGNGYFAQQMQNALSKSIKSITNILKKISSFLMKSVGQAWKWAKTKLWGFFTKTWKLLESIKLFSLLGKLIGGLGSAVKGTLNVGGDLVGSLVKGLLSGGVGAAVSAGLKSLGAALGGITAAALTSALAAAILAASGYAISKTVNLVSNNVKANKLLDQYYDGDGMYEYNGVKYKIPDEVVFGDGSPESIKNRDKRIVEWINSKQERADANDKDRYERWIKEYPSIAKDLGFDRPWWGQDDDKNGWKDYNSDRFNELRNAIKYGVKGIDNEWTKSLSTSTKEELKRKAQLKNTAGVSST